MGAVMRSHWDMLFLRQMRGPEMLPRCFKNLSTFQCQFWELLKGETAQAVDHGGDTCSCGLSQLIRCFLAAEWGKWNLLFNRWHAVLWCQSAFCPVGRCPRGSMPWHTSVCLTCTCFREGRIQVCCCICSKQMVLSPADHFPATADYVSCCFVFFIKLGYQAASQSFLCCVFAANTSGSSGSQPS